MSCAPGKSGEPCSDCKAGRYSDVEDAACELCPRGFYTSDTGQSSCKKCSAGAAFSWCRLLPASTSDLQITSPMSRLVAAAANSSSSIIPKETTTPYDGQDASSSSPPSSSSSLILHVSIAVASLVVLASHRAWPRSCSKLDLIFARKHKVENEHAVREVESRLGAAFFFVFLFVAVGLAVNALETLNEQTSSALEQMPSARLKTFAREADQALAHTKNGKLSSTGDRGTFGALVVTAEAVSLEHYEKNCDDIIEPVAGGGNDGSGVLGCTWQSPKRVDDGDDSSSTSPSPPTTTVCRMSWVCSVPSAAQGRASLTMRLPVTFQAVSWSSTTTTWVQRDTADPTKITPASRVGGRKNTTLESVLMPTAPGASGARSLCGDDKAPSTLSMRLTRGFSQVDLAGSTKGTTAGLLVGWDAAALTECDDRSKLPGAGSEEDQEDHYVRFEFNVNSAVHVETTTDILDATSRVSILLSLVSTAVAVIGGCKLVVGLAVDKAYVTEYCRGRRGQRGIPEDVKRRQAVLAETVRGTATAETGATDEGGDIEMISNPVRGGASAARSEIAQLRERVGKQQQQIERQQQQAEAQQQQIERQQQQAEAQQQQISLIMKQFALSGENSAKSVGPIQTTLDDAIADAAVTPVTLDAAASPKTSLADAGWTRHFDEHGKVYYADENGNVQWDPPPGFAEEGGVDESAAALVSRRKSFLARKKRRGSSMRMQTALQNAASRGQQRVSSGGDETGAGVR